MAEFIKAGDKWINLDYVATLQKELELPGRLEPLSPKQDSPAVEQDDDDDDPPPEPPRRNHSGLGP